MARIIRTSMDSPTNRAVRSIRSKTIQLNLLNRSAERSKMIQASEGTTPRNDASTNQYFTVYFNSTLPSELSGPLLVRNIAKIANVNPIKVAATPATIPKKEDRSDRKTPYRQM